MKVEIKEIFILMIALLTLQGCSGSGGLTASHSKEYDQNFDRMKEVVNQAIRASNMNINFVNESDDANKMTLSVSRDKYLNNEEVQQEQGEVRIIQKDETTTLVEVENPEYHFSVPSHQKEDYQRIIFTRIDTILDK